MEVVISAIVGLLAGTVGSLIAPWVHWSIEKRKSKIEYRREQIRKWREEINASDTNGVKPTDTAAYSAMRPYLDPELVKKLENALTIFASGGRGPNTKKLILLDEITRLEREWGLI